jgi:hypothetical protein
MPCAARHHADEPVTARAKPPSRRRPSRHRADQGVDSRLHRRRCLQPQIQRRSTITRAELIRYFTLTEPDDTFVRQFRGPANILGAAVQSCTLPWLGFVPDDVHGAPAVAVSRLAERVHVPAGELSGYAVREQTRTDHLREIQR